MESNVASNTNSNALQLDTTINNGYLKSANKYLSNTAPTDSTLARPRVIQWDPHMGTDQSTISVVLEHAISEANEEVQPMKLVFGQLVVETNQQQQRAPTASPISTSNNGNLIWITLVAHVPKFSDTQVESSSSANLQVPLSICVYDSRNKDTATDHWNFGIFTYKKASTEVKQEYDGNIQRKRSASDEELSDYASSAKRSNTSTTALEDDQLFNQLLAPFEDSPRASNNSASATLENHPQPLLAPQPSNPTSLLTQISNHHPQQQQNSYQQPAPGGYYGFNDYNQQHHPSMLTNIQPTPTSSSSSSSSSNNNTYSTPAIAAPYSNSMSYHQGYQHGNNGYNLPVVNSSNANSIYPSYGSMQQPPMMNINQNNPSQQIMMNNANNNVHPFAGVLSKANLKITGDLMEMAYNWTQDEWTNGRRLVEFWRRQGGEDEDKKIESEDETISEVECGFKPIEQEVYQQQRIRENLAAQKDATLKKKSSPLVVSCIYWQERNDYFITSVDCIYLLEGLIGVQFTVEEKNRIRRNLEGFRPLTVSKCKPECADFFKLIMSFPHPKPRNIEKDVKVFSWKTLPNALKKIIRKYTPSYSSTAVVNLNND